MKNLYRNFSLTKFIMLCLCIQIAGYSSLKSQTYSFTAVQGTFTPLSGGTRLTSVESGACNTSFSVNPGFTFRYNGVNYTNIYVSQGFLAFSGVTFCGFNLSNVPAPIIAPFYQYMSGANGGLCSHKTEGTTPNRTFTVEWLNWGFSSGTAKFSMQIKIYETSNKIEFIYRPETASFSSYASIGLAFQKTGEFISLNNSGASPTASSEVSTSNISSFPVSGQVYRFTPVINPEPSNHATGFETFYPGSVSVKWIDAVGTTIPDRYLIKTSNVSFAAITNPADGVELTQDLDLKDGTGAVYVKKGVQQFKGWSDSAGNQTIYMKIFPLTNPNTLTNYKIDGTIPQLQISVPVYEARNLECSDFTANSINLKWVRGSRSNCIVFVKENTSGRSTPVNNTTYTANAAYGSGTQIGSTGWYCVYKGTANSVNVTGLKPYTSYAVHVLEYNGGAGAEQYSTVDELTSYKTYKTNLFNDIGTAFTGVKNSSVAWCDYDNDGDLDFIAAGTTASGRSTILYRNNGGGAFVNSGVVFPEVNYSSVSWGDYDNDGFADLVIAGTSTSSVRISKVYHNNGNGTFSELATAGLTGINAGNVIWGDYNSDGYADIFLCGSTGSGIISKIYMNLKNSTFAEQEVIKLPGIDYSSCLWGDFDNDEDLDLLISGYTGSSYITSLYRNDGKNSFVAQTGLSFPQISNSSLDAGDYDNDGDLDILFTGNLYYSSNVAKIFKNNGNLSFQEQSTINLFELNNSSARWGDMDNDGDLDILITGTKNYIPYSKVYLNNGDNTFTEDESLAFPAVDYSSVAWADFDNDKDLDLLLSGQTATGIITKVFRNEISLKNQVPSAPTGLTSVLSDKVVLKWRNINSAATPTKALTYNVRLGKTPGAYDIVSPLSSADGFRRIASLGNAQQDTIFALENIKKGTYYWTVQAVDNNFAGGPLAEEQSFTFNTDIPANSLVFRNIMAKSVKCLWNRGNGDKCVLFAKENGSNSSVPVNNTTYTADASFGSGSQIGTSGWYCVYNGDKDSITVGNLKPNTQYQFHVVEYSGTAGNEVYYTVKGSGDNASHTTSLFSDQNSISMPGVSFGNADWGDYDNDGFLDLIYCGENGSTGITKIYHNNGNNTFTELAQSIAGVSSGNVAWGDYDNDGDLDFLLTGYYSSKGIAKIYRNNNGIFEDQTQITLTGVTQGSMDWGDYDNDGYLDIIISGSAGSTPVTKIYRNTGTNNFVEQTNISLRGLDTGSVAWGDYDNDGLLDILLTGGGSGYYTEIYRNNGNNTFSNVDNSIEEVWRSCGVWGDYDNDGDLDILVAGAPNSVAKIYTNNGNGTFTYDAGTGLAGFSLGTVAWGDYDNDGDLDILESGYDQTFKIMQYAKVFRNNGDKTFTELTNMAIAGVSEGEVMWGDYDNDKDLDIFVCGYIGNGGVAKIYKNETVTPDNLPAAPVGLTSSLEGEKLLLKWKSVRTDETLYTALSYNVRVGSGPGKSDFTSVMANDTITKPNAGYRRVARMGNAQLDTTFILKNLKKGTYYWSVQAVDNSFAGGLFAPEQSFVYNVDVQASNVGTLFKNLTSAKSSWVRGNGEKCVVFVKENGTGLASPENNITYSGNKEFGTGTQIGTSGWYCVYNGDLDTATISRLKSGIEYRFHVIEYSGAAGAEVYYTAAGMNNPTQYLPPFSEQTQISLTGLSGNTNAWGDYDNDGDLDLIIGGYTGSQNVAELHQNNGDNTFTKTSLNLGLNSYDDLQWGDFDNDNDLDLLVLSSWGSKVFENTGNGSFAAVASLAIMSGGKGEWADLNNDGYKDIIFTTMSETKVYKNNKDKTFTQQTTTMPGLSNHSSIACGDYDNDGDLDVLLAGLNSSAAITKVFRNDGNFAFAEQTGIVLPGISNCSVDWADMDNDGDLDIIISGADYDFATKIYDNGGNNTFTEIAGTPFKELYRSSLAIGDYDNDGYRDLLVSGSYDGSDYYTILYKNNGNKTYTEVKTVSFPGIQYGSLNWGDYDNDNDLDFFMCGMTANGRISKVFRNNGANLNSRPGTIYPSYTLDGSDVKITWYKPGGDKTAAAGMSYNLYVYETSKTIFTRSGEAFTYSHALNGRKLVASFGDLQYNSNGYTIKGLPAGDYKISMQAVDAGMLGGSFSSENSYSIFDLSAVSLDFATSYIINTKSGMQYSINSTDGVNGTWTNCYGNQNYVNLSTGGCDLWIRQSYNTKNNRKVATIAPQAAAPAYTINFVAETTVENIPATVEYSTSSNFWNSSTGTDIPVNLSLGSTLYLRTKATASTMASAVQNLVVPARPSAPAFTIDFATEKTAQVIPSNVEYSASYDMSNATSGTGEPLGVVAQQSLYFRTKGTSSTFKSAVQTLTVPARAYAPSFTIDYSNETTSQIISSAYEYSASSDMSGSITGNGTKIAVTPGESLYLRTKSTSSAFSSAVQKLTSPVRPATPSYGIDFTNETTSTYVSGSFEYSRNQDMSNSTTGNNTKIQVVPGEKIYIQVKATSSAFKSLIQTLEVPARPAAPTNLITDDGSNTFDWDIVPGFTEVSDYEYSTNGGNSWIAVNAKPMSISNLNVSAGNFKLRIKATSSRFKGSETASTLAFTTGIIKLEEIGVRMYPNPASDILYLENLPEESVIYIFNLNGKLLVQKSVEGKDMKIPLTDLPQGLYLLKIQTLQKEYQSKFTKQ